MEQEFYPAQYPVKRQIFWTVNLSKVKYLSFNVGVEGSNN